MSAFLQEICPVTDGKIDKRYFVDYEGKRIYFCCPSCPDTFMKDPEKYMKKLKEKGVRLEDAPSRHHEHEGHLPQQGEEPEPEGKYQKHFEKHHTTFKKKSKSNQKHKAKT